MNLVDNKFLKHFKHLPIGMTGMAVGISGLGNLYTYVLEDSGVQNLATASVIQIIFSSIAIILLILILLRNLTHKHTFSNELSHPLLSSFLPTIFMTLMLIGGFFASIGNMIDQQNRISDACQAMKGIGAIIWYIAIIGHIAFLIMFLIKVVAKHNIKSDSLYASWFVPPVGIIVACTIWTQFLGIPNGPQPINWIPNEFAQAIWYFGFVMYMVTFPIVSYKLIFHGSRNHDTLPSIAIFGAPANLSLVGFYTVFRNLEYYGQFVNIMMIILIFLGLATTLVVYLLLARIFKIRFNPTFACLTFPLAIGATAMFRSSQFIQNIGLTLSFNDDLFWILRIISYIELSLATIVIGYVFINYIILIVKKIKQPVEPVKVLNIK